MYGIKSGPAGSYRRGQPPAQASELPLQTTEGRTRGVLPSAIRAGSAVLEVQPERRSGDAGVEEVVGAVDRAGHVDQRGAVAGQAEQLVEHAARPVAVRRDLWQGLRGVTGRSLHHVLDVTRHLAVALPVLAGE